jgi:hypothetical protein
MHEVLAESLGERSSFLIPISTMRALGWRRTFDPKKLKCCLAWFFPCKQPFPHPRRPSSSVHSKCLVRGPLLLFFAVRTIRFFLPNQVRFPFSCEECPPKRAAWRQPRIEASPQTPAVVSVPIFAGSTAPDNAAEQLDNSLCGQRNSLDARRSRKQSETSDTCSTQCSRELMDE